MNTNIDNIYTECYPPQINGGFGKRVFYGTKCSYCNVKLTPSNMTMDHVDPYSKTLLSNHMNLTPVCNTCNQEKSNKDLLYFLGFIDKPVKIKTNTVNKRRKISNSAKIEKLQSISGITVKLKRKRGRKLYQFTIKGKVTESFPTYEIAMVYAKGIQIGRSKVS